MKEVKKPIAPVLSFWIGLFVLIYGIFWIVFIFKTWDNDLSPWVGFPLFIIFFPISPILMVISLVFGVIGIMRYKEVKLSSRGIAFSLSYVMVFILTIIKFSTMEFKVM